MKSQAVSCMKMQSVSNFHGLSLSLSSGVDGWVTPIVFIPKEYALRAWCPILMWVTGMGHQNPFYTYHITPDDGVYKILDMNSIFTWLIAWKDFIVTSWMYCIVLLCKIALMCIINNKSVNIHDLLRTNISPRQIPMAYMKHLVLKFHKATKAYWKQITPVLSFN